MTSTAVANVEPSAAPYALRSPIAQILSKDAARALIEPMLRPGDSYERVIVETYHASQKNSDILKCTPASIVNAVSRAVRSGLVIGEGVHLVPYGSTLQEIYDYKGRIQLIVTAGAARAIDAQCVYEHEPFDYSQGTSPSISHKPIMNPAKRGKMIGAYAIADQGRRVPPKIVVLSVDEIEKVRQTYSKQHKKGDLPYWYAQKTCVHRLAKLLPKNPELAKVVAMFEAEDAGLEAIANDEPAPAPYMLSSASAPQIGAGSNDEIEGLGQEGEGTASSIGERAPLDEPQGSTTGGGVEENRESHKGDPSTSSLAGPALYPLPFSWEGHAVKTPIGLVPREPLERAVMWAKKSNATGRHMEFIQAGEMHLDDRRQGEAQEPKAES